MVVHAEWESVSQKGQKYLLKRLQILCLHPLLFPMQKESNQHGLKSLEVQCHPKKTNL